ncbi:MAG: alpha/beta fold hydrolase [Kiloniellales bacterium]
MGMATTDDGVRLYYEGCGQGRPVVFVHEFAGDHRSWEPQVRFFSRRYRCITYNARGYPPSDVPEAVSAYSQARAVEDLRCLLDHLEIDQAHVVGLSMGGFCTLHFGLTYPGRALSLIVAGCGYGAEKDKEAAFRRLSDEVAQGFERQGSEAFAKIYAEGAARVQLQNKDPRGWQVFASMLGQHSALGSANTMRGVQARRPSLYDLEDELAALRLPTLVINGDEDDNCLQPGLFLKRTIPACGLLVLPKTGHTMNLEEPDTFNHAAAEFFAMVEAGRWTPRDPRARPDEIMRTD